jgi:hypothetical protein
LRRIQRAQSSADAMQTLGDAGHQPVIDAGAF